MKTHIAGIPYRHPDLPKVAIGDSVEFTPEPDNKFDPDAVMVMHRKQHLGYLPRDLVRVLKGTTLDPKIRTSATVVEVDPAHKWHEAAIEISNS